MSSEPMYRAQAAKAVPMRPLPAHPKSWSERFLHAKVLQYRGRRVEWGIARLGFGASIKWHLPLRPDRFHLPKRVSPRRFLAR